MTPAEHAALQEALAKAVPAPWRAVIRDKELRLVVGGADHATVAWSGHGNKDRAEAHAVLIAALPGILAELDALKADRDRLLAENRELHDAWLTGESRIEALLAENARLREGHKDAAVHLIGAASAYRTHAARHRSKGRAVADPFFSTRADDFDKAVKRARALLTELEGAKT